MDVAPYLARLNYSGPRDAGFDSLCGLHAAHMRSVPFENLDIVPLHRPIRLDEASLYEKLIEKRRGGFCYELNGTFGWLLRQLGFDVTYLNARVFNRKGELGIDFDHLALLVSAPGNAGPWLADVGFGDSFTEPLVIAAGEQTQGLRSYRLEQEQAGNILWQRGYDGEWTRLYFFDLTPRRFPSDYLTACEYHQRSPLSTFTHSGVISRATPNGRVTLEERKLIVTEDGRRTETEVASGEWAKLLEEHFGVRL